MTTDMPTTRLIRRIPIDWRAIARETGCTTGTLCKTAFGWGIRNGDNGINLNLCTAPETADGETLRIEEGMWAIYRTP